MIEIRLDNNEKIELTRKSILLMPPGSRQDHYVNEIYDVIMIIAGVDRNLNLILNRKSILIIEAGVRTSENSQVVFIAGVNNSVKGITRQNRGRIYNIKDEEFDLAAVANFEQITIIK